MTKKEFVCIVCPNSCTLSVTFNEETNEIQNVMGAKCKKGEAYAASEITAPVRTLTTTVKVNGGTVRLTSVRSTKPIPKNMLIQAVQTISSMEVDAPVRVGDVLIPDILHTNADIIITKQVLIQ